MIPYFEEGSPVSAGKFNALGNSIRALSGGGSAAGEMMVPQHFDGPPLPEMDFAVMFRKDDAGSWGWCCHQGRVIVKGKDHPVGEKEWTLISNDAYTGDIKLVVTLDDEGKFSSGTVQEGEAGEGSDTTREFTLATIGKELVWKHSGGPVYIVNDDDVIIKAGKGIQVEEKKEEGEGKDKGKTWKVSGDIRDSHEKTTEDVSLIYVISDSEGGEDPKTEDPIYLKLLCSSDDSVSIRDEDGRIYLSATGKMPKAGDGLEYETQQNGEGVEEETDTLRIRIDSSVDSGSGENGKWPVNLSVSPDGLKGELDLTVDTQEHEVGGGFKVALSTATKGTLSLEVTSGEEAEPLSFRAPIRQNGKYVVLDYDTTWSDTVNGLKVHLFDQNGTLAVELHAETEPDGTDSLISDSWTALACDSDHALRLNRDEHGRIYIQQGEWTSGNYTPMN